MFPLAALGVLATGAGIFHENLVALALGVPLLLGPLLVYLSLRAALRGMEVERVAPGAVFEGETVEIRIRLRNRFWLPVFYPQIADVFSPEIHAQKKVHFPFRVLPGETVEGGYRGKCLLPRGIYSLGPGVITLSDPFGWMQLKGWLTLRQRIKVYPRILPLGLPEKLGEAVAALADEQTCRGTGESLEFFSARDYRSGDPLRKIHWPLTAHRGLPVVREFARNATGNLTIFLDLHRSALIGIGRGSSLEYAVKITVSLADHALRRGLGVQVLARGQEDLVVPTGGGRGHLRGILDLAVQARPEGDFPLPDLIGREEHRLRRGDCAVFTIGPYLYRSEELFHRLRALRRRGVRMVAGIFDDRTFRTLWYGESFDEEERQEFTARLRELSVGIYTIPCGAPLEQVFPGERR